MPHMFHMIFAENRDSKFLHTASWGLPFLLLILSISTPLILWAGLKLGTDMPPEYFPLAIGQSLNKPWLTLIAYTGGLSAASGLIIVTSLALSSMLMNHVILPWYQPREPVQVHVNIYRRLTWLKRFLITALIMASYGFYSLVGKETDLYNLGIVAYVGALQLLPGTLATLYWSKANHKGFICGLVTGATIWFIALMLPLMTDFDAVHISYFGEIASDEWYFAALGSLLANAVVFYLVSRLTTMGEDEVRAAEACLVRDVKRSQHKVPKANSAYEFQEMLSVPLGSQVAQAEVSKALSDISMRPDDNRPHALRRLRDRIEINLSGLMGPTIAHEIVESFIPLDTDKEYVSQDIHFMESRLEAYHSRLTGLAGELDSLRRYHRDTLNSLPLALCSLDNNNEVMMWNQAMAEMTGITAENIIGSPVDSIAEPWQQMLDEVIHHDQSHIDRHHLEIEDSSRYFSVHKASIQAPVSGTSGNQVILIEDQTETHMLNEQLFHSERLASIGQLAAGVAHEIGNPITGIDCLAQELKAIAPDPDVKESALHILEQTKRVTAIVQMLMSYAHHGDNNSHGKAFNTGLEPVNIHDCIKEAVNLLQLSQKNSNITFLNHCSSEHIISGNNQKLQQVFINLLKNAADASEDGGLIIINSSATMHTVTTEVEDEGHGIPRKIQEKLFEPFFTTKETGEGTGLGLALTWNIIEEHFGTISVVSPVDESTQRGTRFIISLPRFEFEDIESQNSVEPQGETV